MNNTEFVNIARLLTTFNFEIEELSDNLKCAKCKLVLKDACRVPCGCIFCQVCINDMITSGGEFCPGVSENCGKTLLSLFSLDNTVNEMVSRLTVKCAYKGCVHECQLANVEKHLRECPRKSEECPFRELGCVKDKLAAEEMGVADENCGQSEILIGMVANINREIEVLKRRNEESRKEYEMMKKNNETSRQEIERLNKRDEDNMKEIEMLKERDKTIMGEVYMLKKRDEDKMKEINMLTERVGNQMNEIEMLKERDDGKMREIEKLNKVNENNIEQIDILKEINMANIKEIEIMKEKDKDVRKEIELVLKDKQTNTTIDEMINVKNENKSITPEKRENDELDSAVRVIEYVDREIAAIKAVIRSNKDDLVKQMKSVRNNVGLINQGAESIKDNICSMKSQLESIEVLVGFGCVDARYYWMINEDVGTTNWNWRHNPSGDFSGAIYPYSYVLASENHVHSPENSLAIWLRIYCGPNDNELVWPFEGLVVITVADNEWPEVSMSFSKRCQIERPRNNDYKCSPRFLFEHHELIGAGLNLGSGVCVKCLVVPDED